MEIKPHRLQAFRELYRQETGTELSDSEAHEKASLLLRYGLLRLRPMPPAGETPGTELQ